MERKTMMDEVDKKVLSSAVQKEVYVLLKRLKHHHPYTYFHSLRVARFSLQLARELGLPEAEQENLARSALLHDIGKLLVPSRLLDKRDKLTQEEWRQLQAHPRCGAEIVMNLTANGTVDREVILYHHENLDGTGYPFGIDRTHLSLGVRIVRIADSYDAMTSTRGYNRPMGWEQAMDELYCWSNIHFDLEVVGLFHQLLRRGR